MRVVRGGKSKEKPTAGEEQEKAEEPSKSSAQSVKWKGNPEEWESGAETGTTGISLVMRKATHCQKIPSPWPTHPTPSEQKYQQIPTQFSISDGCCCCWCLFMCLVPCDKSLTLMPTDREAASRVLRLFPFLNPFRPTPRPLCLSGVFLCGICIDLFFGK